MPDSLTVDIRASVDWLFEETLDLSSAVDNSQVEYKQGLTDGVGTNQADKIWHDTRSLAGGADDDLDLSNLVNQLFGSTVTISLARVKAILIHNTATAAGEDLLLDSSVANALLAPFNGSANSKIEIPADSTLLLVNRGEGWPVAPATADRLRITSDGAGSIDYKIVLVGTSA